MANMTIQQFKSALEGFEATESNVNFLTKNVPAAERKAVVEGIEAAQDKGEAVSKAVTAYTEFTPEPDPLDSEDRIGGVKADPEYLTFEGKITDCTFDPSRGGKASKVNDDGSVDRAAVIYGRSHFSIDMRSIDGQSLSIVGGYNLMEMNAVAGGYVKPDDLSNEAALCEFFVNKFVKLDVRGYFPKSKSGARLYYMVDTRDQSKGQVRKEYTRPTYHVERVRYDKTGDIEKLYEIHFDNLITRESNAIEIAKANSMADIKMRERVETVEAVTAKAASINEHTAAVLAQLGL